MTLHAWPGQGAEESAGAWFSGCEQYRYMLTRRWADGPTVTFVMLNPSTADARNNDPTIRRCLGYARAWGCGRLKVVNLYAYRSTKPAGLWKVEDPVGPENDAHLEDAAYVAARDRGLLVAAWGVHARPDRIVEVLAIPGMDRLMALGVTKAGAPRHPLMMRADAKLSPWPEVMTP